MYDTLLGSTHTATKTIPEDTTSLKQWSGCERCKINERKASTPSWILLGLAYGLIFLLFIWNAALWLQITELRSELRVLKFEPDDSEAEYIPTAYSLSQVTEERTVDKRPQNNILNSIRRTAKVKRSTRKEETESTENSISGGFLTRLRRSVVRNKARSQKRKRKRPDRAKKRRCKERKVDSLPVSPARTPDTQATAIHVSIKGTPPYRGTPLGGRDGVIRQWGTADGGIWNQGFDVSNLNATDYSAGVIVKKTGVYYFYGQVAFSLGHGIDFHEKIEIGMTHIMTELASCVNYPVSRRYGDSDLITCHSSGIARMEKGWKFRLRIYPTNLNVYNDPRYTYFGAFFIGNAED